MAVVQYTFTHKKYIERYKTNNTLNNTTILEECGPCPVLASYTLAFALQPRKKHGKTSVMAHAQKPDFVFRRNERVHLNRQGRQFSRLMAAEVCALAVVMLDTTCSQVVWRVLATHSIRQFPLQFPSRASPCAITFQLESTLVRLPDTEGRGATLLRIFDNYLQIDKAKNIKRNESTSITLCESQTSSVSVLLQTE